MKRKLLTIILISISVSCFSQGKKAGVIKDSKSISGTLVDSAALKKQYIDSMTVVYNAPLLSIVDMIKLRSFIENYMDDKSRAAVIVAQIEVAIADAEKRKKKQ